MCAGTCATETFGPDVGTDLVKTFGEKTLGATTGFMLFGCGVFNLLVYPLSLTANTFLGGDLRPIFCGLAVVPAVAHLIVVRRLGQLKAGLMPQVFNKTWVELMDAVRNSNLHRWGTTKSCPICMEPFAW